MDLNDISLSVKTFLRDNVLYNTIRAVQKNLPEVQLIITDDGDITDEKREIYDDLSRKGHLCFTLPFDSGFGVKSNLAASALVRKMLLIGSDDFDFNPPEVRQGIEKMAGLLDQFPKCHIVSGRVNNRPYEFWLEDTGDTVIETPCLFDELIPKLDGIQCDLTVNYSLIRKEVFQKVQWDDEVCIGQGEHGAFFVDVKRAGFMVCYAFGVNINEQPNQNSDRYRQFRNRATSLERSCFKKRGIKKYVLGDGTIDYNEITPGN